MSVYKISKFPFGKLIFMQQYTRKSGLNHENRQKLALVHNPTEPQGLGQ